MLIKLPGSISVKDPVYDTYATQYQAKTPAGKAFYLFAYLLPGIIAYVLVNIEPVHRYLSAVLGLKGYNFQ